MDWDDLKNFADDPISLNKLSFPDDWCVCELKRKKGLVYTSELFEVKLASSISNVREGIDCYTIGYPGIIRKENRAYAAPESTPEDLTAIRNAVCYPYGPIITRGQVIKIGDVICSSAPTIFGMSGSPLLIEIKGKLRVIGLLHGGPASGLHYCISRLLNKINSRNFLEELEHFYGVLKIHLKKFNHEPGILRTLKSMCHDLIKSPIHSPSNSDEIYDLCFLVYKRSINLEAKISPLQKYNIFYSLGVFYKSLKKIINCY